MLFINFLWLLLISSVLTSKHPLTSLLDGDDVFMGPYKIVSMEIKCQYNSSAPAGQNVAIDLDNYIIAKFVRKERLDDGQLLTQYVDKHFDELLHELIDLRIVNPVTPDCHYVNWILMLEEKVKCRNVHAILRNVPQTKEDVLVTLAWINHIATGSYTNPITSWTGTYFPRAKFIHALYLANYHFRRIFFAVENEIRIEPVDYVLWEMEFLRLHKLVMEKAEKEGMPLWKEEIHHKFQAHLKNLPLVNFDAYYPFLRYQTFTEKLHFNGRLLYSENLLNYIANGSLAQLEIDHTYGEWPKSFFDSLINLLDTDSFNCFVCATGRFGYFNIHMENAVPWANTSQFKFIDTIPMAQGFETYKYVWERPGPKRWTMSLLTNDGAKSFVKFLLHTDEHAEKEEMDKLNENANEKFVENLVDTFKKIHAQGQGKATENEDPLDVLKILKDAFFEKLMDTLLPDLPVQGEEAKVEKSPKKRANSPRLSM